MAWNGENDLFFLFTPYICWEIKSVGFTRVNSLTSGEDQHVAGEEGAQSTSRASTSRFNTLKMHFKQLSCETRVGLRYHKSPLKKKITLKLICLTQIQWWKHLKFWGFFNLSLVFPYWLDVDFFQFSDLEKELSHIFLTCVSLISAAQRLNSVD